jgi:hypothetical protein
MTRARERKSRELAHWAVGIRIVGANQIERDFFTTQQELKKGIIVNAPR